MSYIFFLIFFFGATTDVATLYAELQTKASKGELSSGLLEAKKQATATARIVKEEVTKLTSEMEVRTVF